ncbi:hypothetical protein HEQ62_10180 [Haematospirillum jordaniae]|uniref:Uncharacterized protein n=1 Tax=Haematospirillum jordaniae TaxID=1549855 RepID=A0A143DGQ9_9PROT|nr:hypothetical protein [Haematospirillum jordaniae]AMW35730.1 hypothetical protein AY555_10140 [Haematospirillum jordaniae]NKD45981.1 hypothetical protein [Haematospirillum jordaniae]NKD60137.1 hypothetical protein [Haematospirillum jordaniae]NKD68062.1 hypothetical protein [Haematospirillum jordaniae]NKD82235.1 hypothetical protein [Haematospirillum jordaniae]
MPDGFNALQREVRSAASRSPEFLSFDGLVDAEDVCDKAVCMEYTNADGGKSKRWITMRSIDEDGPTPKFFAYCWVRRQVRSFRADRVETFIDCDGECISGRDFFERIGVNLPPPASVSRSRKKSRKADTEHSSYNSSSGTAATTESAGTGNTIATLVFIGFVIYLISLLF